MRRSSKLLLGGILVLPLTVTVALPALASNAAPRASAVIVGPNTNPPSEQKTKIVTGAVYSPAVLHNALAVSGACSTSAPATFLVKNTTTVPEYVTEDGQNLPGETSPLGKGYELVVCLPPELKHNGNPIAQTLTFGLSSNEAATLTVHVPA